MPMPGVFSAINTRLQTPLVGKNLHTISKGLPEAIVETQEGWVESKQVPGTDVFIRGKYDLLAKRPDESYILIDLKISQPNDDKIEKYQSQLNAYKYALENPANGEAKKISMLALLIFYPDTVKFTNGTANFSFPPTWLEVPTNGSNFLEFMKDVDNLLHGPIPEEGEGCKWCKYRHQGETLAHEENVEIEDIQF